MKDKIKDYSLTIYIVLNVLYVLVGSYLFSTHKITMHDFSKTYISLLVLNLIIIIGIIIKKVIKKEKIRFNPVDLFFVWIFIFSLVSAILSIHTESAFFGFRGRYEGFFQIMYYFSLFFLSSFLDKKNKKIVSYAILFAGAVEVIYAILQVTQWLPVFTQYHHKKPWATGFVTNPNFFGSLTVLCLSSTIGFFFDADNKYKKIIFSLLIILFMWGLLISDTLSAFVGLIVVLMYLFVYSIIKKKKLKFAIVILLLSLMTTILTCTGSTRLVKDFIKTKNQSVEIAKGHIKDNYGSNRMYIWKNTLRVVPDNLFIGVGIDNFYYAFGDRPLTMKGWFFDKAHNEYLQILVCEGILALISYLAFFGYITINGIKYSIKNNKLFLILPVIGYLVQAFFNISVIEVAPFFYVTIGLCLIRDEKIKS